MSQVTIALPQRKPRNRARKRAAVGSTPPIASAAGSAKEAKNLRKISNEQIPPVEKARRERQSIMDSFMSRQPVLAPVVRAQKKKPKQRSFDHTMYSICNPEIGGAFQWPSDEPAKTAWFNGIIDETLYLSTGVRTNYAKGSYCVHTKPLLNSPVTMLIEATPVSSSQVVCVCDSPTAYSGLWLNSEDPGVDVSNLADKLAMQTGLIYNVVGPCTYTLTTENHFFQVKGNSSAGGTFYGIPAYVKSQSYDTTLDGVGFRQQRLRVALERSVRREFLKEKRRSAELEGKVDATVNFVVVVVLNGVKFSSEGGAVTLDVAPAIQARWVTQSAVGGWVGYDANLTSADSGDLMITIPTSGFTLNADDLPGFGIQLRIDSESSGPFANFAVIDSVSYQFMLDDQHSQLHWKNLQLPNYLNVLSDYDRYRVNAMSTWVQCNSSMTENGGSLATYLNPGGAPPTLDGLVFRQDIASRPGAYAGPVRMGSYAWWHPYTDLDMQLRNRKYIYNYQLPHHLSIGVVTSDEASMRLRVCITYECTTRLQHISTKQSSTNEALLRRIKSKFKYAPTAMSNDWHTEIIKALTIPGAVAGANWSLTANMRSDWENSLGKLMNNPLAGALFL